jgi:hypothetical protein
MAQASQSVAKRKERASALAEKEGNVEKWIHKAKSI